MRAIIVDDEPWMCRYFAETCAQVPALELTGSFGDPAEALQYVRENPVDIAFLDYRMPRMNGMELAAAIREHDPAIKIVFLAADDTHQEEARRTGLSKAYLTKPYNAEDLLQAVQSACGNE